MKKCLKAAGILLVALIALFGVYVIYLFATYHRIEDNLTLNVEAPLQESEESQTKLTTGQVYSAVTYNIGFGAYTPDFSFFMDGGKSSWAKSKESVIETVKGAGELTASLDPDFAMIEEIDLDSTRSYHVDEFELLRQCLPQDYTVFAKNYHSAFLFYPFTQPHGKSNSGIGLFSRYEIESSMRRSLPISTSLSKFLDLDRCYSVSKVPVDNGKDLVIYALHASAYGNSDQIREAQISMLVNDMKQEYEAGNYVLCGGDFNHDLKAPEDSAEECESWAYPFPRSALPEYLSFAMNSLTEDEKDALWNSSRNADMEYVEGVTYTVTLDGFLISDNIECMSYQNINTGYRWSDHDPVYMEFKLK